MITAGHTRVLCTASIASEVPRWMRDEQPARGWVTAEYAMLPGSTSDRIRRGPSGRSSEIQRLIGRTLRAAVDLEKMPDVLITCDCDVLVADGGTRTASITGAYVALVQAVAHCRREGLITHDPLRGRGPVAAISVGLVDDQAWLDLDYELDARAQVDMNVAMNAQGRYIEIQGTGEQGTFDPQQLDTMLALARKGINRLIRLQRQALSS